MKVLVVGDSCLDIFKYGLCERLSPEAPVPIFKPIDFTTKSGMAGNVYDNFISLGVNCELITNIVQPVKTRFVDKHTNQQLMRLDESDSIHRIPNTELPMQGWDAVVISDYNKGFLTLDDIHSITSVAKLNGSITFLDTKKTLTEDSINFLSNVDFIKINENEYNKNKLALTQYSGSLIVTLGNRGAMFNNTVYPTERVANVLDLSGAGDTFLSALVFKFIETKNTKESIDFANKCASWVITQRGVTTIDLNKI